MLTLALATLVETSLACERRRISGCRFSNCSSNHQQIKLADNDKFFFNSKTSPLKRTKSADRVIP